MSIEWKDTQKGEKPVSCIDCGLVIYKDDYEFGRYDGEKWQVYYEDEWNDIYDEVRYWSRLNKPE